MKAHKLTVDAYIAKNEKLSKATSAHRKKVLRGQSPTKMRERSLQARIDAIVARASRNEHEPSGVDIINDFRRRLNPRVSIHAVKIS